MRPQPVGEYELKAAYLYNFALLSEWPEGALPAPDAPLALCVLGRNPFGPSLAALEVKTVHGRRLEARQVPTAAAARRCHLLFIAAPELARASEIVAALGDAPVLTVADSGAAERTPAVITLGMHGSRVAFSVDLGAAKRARLRLSSRLLRLAAGVAGAEEAR